MEMDGSTTAERGKSQASAAWSTCSGLLRRRSFLAGVGSVVLIGSVPATATAVEPSAYGHGYRGGYR